MMDKYRPDDWAQIQLHKDKFRGGKALVVLGGASASKWEKLRDKIQPDVILGANGTVHQIKDLTYWLIAENMSRAAHRASKEPRQKEFMRMFTVNHSAEFRLISHRSWHLLQDTKDCISIRRVGYDLQPDVNLREYGEGYLHGYMFDRPGCLRPKVKFRVGTVATHLLHHAGILGVDEVHTIGMDFCFKGSTHHWYNHPGYRPDNFRTAAMFTKQYGLKTMWDWIDGVLFFRDIEPLFRQVGLKWVDHSKGLLRAMRLWCAA